MLPTGDTTNYAAHDWAFNQALYIGGSLHHLLLVLVHHAFYKATNPENAPVGQVLLGYSSVDVLTSRTGLSASTLKRALQALQSEHGYLTRTPRPHDGEPGRTPRIIRLYWTAEDDATRGAHRKWGTPLPEAFTVSAKQIDAWNRRSHLRPVLQDRYEL